MKKLLAAVTALFLGAGLIVSGPNLEKQATSVKAENLYEGKLLNQDYLESIVSYNYGDVSNGNPYYTIDASNIDSGNEYEYAGDSENHSLTFYLDGDLAIKGPIKFVLTNDYYVINIHLNSNTVTFNQQNENDGGGFFSVDHDNVDSDVSENIVFNVYGGSGKTNYFSKNNVTHRYVSDPFGNIAIEGGCFAGFNTMVIYLNRVGTYNFYDINFIGNDRVIQAHDTKNINMYNCLISDNYTTLNKAGIIECDHSDSGAPDLCMDGCVVENNHTYNYSVIAMRGMDDVTDSSSLYLNNTKIVNNDSDQNWWPAEGPEAARKETSAGVSFTIRHSGCFAEGTKVNLANGEYANIEDLKIGDEVLTFNHDTGALEPQEILDVYSSVDNESSFTLNFTNDISLDVVINHGFLNKEENKYVNITESNARNYVGYQFYNAIDDRWETLESVVFNNNSVPFYSIYTAYNFNVITEDMVTLQDDCFYMCNAFDFADGKLYDQDKKQADIEKYGLFTYEDLTVNMSRETFEKVNAKYFNVCVGKGLTTLEQLADSAVEYGVGGESITPKALKKPRKLLHDASTSIKTDTGLYLGSDVIIQNNYSYDTSENLVKSNLFISPYSSFIPLVFFESGSSNCDIGIDTYSSDHRFAKDMTEQDPYIDFFTADVDGYFCDYNNGGYYITEKTKTVSMPTNEQYRLYTGEGIEYSLVGTYIGLVMVDANDFTFSYQDANTLEAIDGKPVKKGRYLVTIDFPGNRDTLPFHDTRYMTIGTRVALNNTGADEPCSLSGTYDVSQYFTSNIINLPYPEKDGDLKLNVENGYVFAGWYDHATGELHQYGASNQELVNNFTGTKHLTAVVYPYDYNDPTKTNDYDVMGSVAVADLYEYQWQKYDKHIYNVIEAAMSSIVYVVCDFDADEKMISTGFSNENAIVMANYSDKQVFAEFQLNDPDIKIQKAYFDDEGSGTLSSFEDIPYNEDGFYSIDLNNASLTEYLVIKAKDDSDIKFDTIRFAQYDYFDIAGETSSQIHVADENTTYRCKITNEYGVSSYSDTIKPLTVTFDTDDGLIANKEAYVLDGRTLDLSKYIPTKTRYDFKGWATSEGGSVVYEGDEIITVEDDITLYAVYFAKNNQFSGTDLTGVGTTADPVTGSVTEAIAGDTYLNTETFNMYRFNGTKWSYIGNIKGEKGDTGETGAKGDTGATGAAGANGTNGTNGSNGLTPFIGTNGNWWIGTTDTGVAAQGAKGDKGDTGATGAAGTNGTNGINGTNGADGLTPFIGTNGNWWIGTTDTGVAAQGAKGDKGDTGATGAAGANGTNGTNGTNGSDGLTPFIGTNGNWWIGTTDTGVAAQGAKGDKGDTGATGAAGAAGTNGTNGTNGVDGQTPYIGANGNWWIGTTDLGVAAQGPQGETGATGETGAAGANGLNGATGATGAKGANGVDGKDGTNLLVPLIISISVNVIVIVAGIIFLIHEKNKFEINIVD